MWIKSFVGHLHNAGNTAQINVTESGPLHSKTFRHGAGERTVTRSHFRADGFALVLWQKGEPVPLVFGERDHCREIQNQIEAAIKDGARLFEVPSELDADQAD